VLSIQRDLQSFLPLAVADYFLVAAVVGGGVGQEGNDWGRGGLCFDLVLNGCSGD